jgi:hypothetical protein
MLISPGKQQNSLLENSTGGAGAGLKEVQTKRRNVARRLWTTAYTANQRRGTEVDKSGFIFQTL